MHRSSALWLALLACLAGCDRKTAEPAPQPPKTAQSAEPQPAPLSAKLSRPAPERLVAIGDMHGDLEAARRALRLAGAIDEKDGWAGGKLMVVVTGDTIDRGDGDRAVMDLLERLVGQAKAAGGELVLLSGNHELMNVQLDLRYVSARGYAEFADVKPHNHAVAAAISQVDQPKRGRIAAFAPGGPYASKIASWPVVMKVGDTVFVHGGVLPKHVAYGLDKMNDEVAAWVEGRRPEPPQVVVSEDGPVWYRGYSQGPTERECDLLKKTLTKLGARRMVVGHTPQQDGITPACNEQVWRIDTGMSRHYGGPTQVLEIQGDRVTVLKPR